MMNLKIQTILNKFFNSKFFSYYKINESLWYYVGGSQLLGVLDEISDIDLIIIVPDNFDYPDISGKKLFYNSIYIDFHYISISEFYNIKKDSPPLCFLTYVQLKKVDYKDIILVNKDVKRELESILKQKDKYLEKGFLLLFDFLQEKLEKIYNSSIIKEIQYTKFFYHLLCGYFLIKNIDFDNKFLTEVKRIRWQKMSDENYIKLVSWLKIIYFEYKNKELGNS